MAMEEWDFLRRQKKAALCRDDLFSLDQLMYRVMFFRRHDRFFLRASVHDGVNALTQGAYLGAAIIPALLPVFACDAA